MKNEQLMDRLRVQGLMQRLRRQYGDQVARSIRKYLKSKRVRFLWVHDGWQCDKAVDPNELLQRVRTQTGFVLELDWTIYKD